MNEITAAATRKTASLPLLWYS